MRWAFATLLLLARIAAADELPAPEHVTVSLAKDRARFVATWHWRAPGGDDSYMLELPQRGLATAAHVTIAGETHELALVEQSRATRAMSQTRQRPRTRPRAGAVVIAGDSEILGLELLMPATGDVDLVVEIEAATCFSGDSRYVLVPASWPASTLQPFTVRACASDPAWQQRGQHWLALPTTEASAMPTDRIAVTAGALVAGERQVARIDVALAAELAPIPTDLHTVFVIDRSRSLGPSERTSEANVLAAYGVLVPSSQLAVVAFDRDARILAPWGTAGTVAPAVGARLERDDLGNGSELLRGLGAAGDLLRGVSGTRRVIVLTDDLFATRLSASALVGGAHLVPAGTIVHTVLLGGQAGKLERVDTTALAPLAAATEGEAFANGAGSLDVTVLARPTELDRVALAFTDPVAGWTRLEGPAFALPALAAGNGVTWWATGQAPARAPSFVTVEGLLWNRRWRATVPLARADHEVARAVLESVTDKTVREGAEDLAQAVDGSWSLYARWGGDGGYPDEGEERGIEGGVCGCDIGGDIGAPLPPPPPPAPPEPTLETQVRAAIARCPLDGATGVLTVETTNDEIVDVGAMLHGERRGARSCMIDAVWAARVHVPCSPRHDAVRIELTAPARPAAPRPRAPAASR